MCSFLLVSISMLNAEQVLSADELFVQATMVYKDGQDDTALQTLIILHQVRKEYEKIVSASFGDVPLLQELAMTLFDLGEYGEDREMFEKAGVKVEVKSFDVVEVVSDKVAVLSNDVIVTDSTVTATGMVTTIGAVMTTGTVSVSTDTEVNSVMAAIVDPHDVLLDTKLAETPSVIHGIELHPDLIYNSSADLVIGNIISFAERAMEMKVNTVFVHAFIKDDAEGAFGSAYFDNSILPVRADVLKPLAKELAARGIAVYAIMPVLSFALAKTDSNNAMMVMSECMKEVLPSVSWRKRISPFNTNGIALITQIYSDLVSSVPLNGIVFGDDGYLTDAEDLNPGALNIYSNKLGINKLVLSELDSVQRSALADLRTEQLDILCKTIMVSAKKEQPQMQFIRTLYATTINHPPSEEWLSQNYKKALQMYDQVLVLADPELEDARLRGTWIRKLSENVVAETLGSEKTIFRLPNYSNVQRSWISVHQQAKLLRMLSKAGLHSFVLGPDDYIADRPRINKAKLLF